jgi:hypothetical protein
MLAMDSAEMARLRWRNVPPEVRSNLARRAALARWAHASETELAEARARAANARVARTKILAARLLGVDPSKLAEMKVDVLPASKFRKRKSQEQAEYWKRLRQEHLERAVYVDQKRASRAAVVHPDSFRMMAATENGNGS